MFTNNGRHKHVFLCAVQSCLWLRLIPPPDATEYFTGTLRDGNEKIWLTAAVGHMGIPSAVDGLPASPLPPTGSLLQGR